MIEKLRIHWQGEDFTADFLAKVFLRWSVTGQEWSDPVYLLPEQDSSGQSISTYYTNDANFGLQLRIGIAVANGTAGNVQVGKITAYLEIVLKS